jgi:hypothetical protein
VLARTTAGSCAETELVHAMRATDAITAEILAGKWKHVFIGVVYVEIIERWNVEKLKEKMRMVLLAFH